MVIHFLNLFGFVTFSQFTIGDSVNNFNFVAIMRIKAASLFNISIFYHVAYIDSSCVSLWYQGTEQQNADEEFGGAQETTRGIGLDPIIDHLESPSRWPIEFEKQQQEIIELWHACNVALAHRTIFFLLFKGDRPSADDAIYMEVELRRLSFLKRTFSRENFDIRTAKGQMVTLASRYWSILHIILHHLFLLGRRHQHHSIL